MRTHRTTFGSLPVGTAFDYYLRVQDPKDRRRKIDKRVTFKKSGHGTIAGWAEGPQPSDPLRFNHYQCVYVDASDLRLLVAIAQQSEGLIK
jgi:hypothetical protein